MRRLSTHAGIRHLTAARRSCVTATAGSREHHPLAVMDKYLRSSKTALNIHRELTLAIANGNAEDAADLARTLAAGVGRFRVESVGRSTDANASWIPSTSMPFPDVATAEDNSERATSVTTATAPAVPGDQAATAVASTADEHNLGEKAWNTPERLTVTILESSFESVDAEDDENPNNVDRDHRILDEYLRQYGSEWKAQKHAIAKVVLDTARALNITPAMIHHDEADDRLRRSSDVLSALKHCNVVVRGEVPQATLSSAVSTAKTDSGGGGAAAVALAEAQCELADLESALQTGGKPPLTGEERHLYLTELLLSKSTMSYSVGILKQLQTSLDAQSLADAVRSSAAALASPQQTPPPLSATFQGALIRNLNRSSPVSSPSTSADVDVSVLRKPVLPFTFMLKICLWYDLSSSG